MRLKPVHIFITILILFFLLSPELIDAQCAMCKASVESNIKNDPNSAAKGINKGILYLMAIPYLLIAFIFRKQIIGFYKKIKGKQNSIDDTI